MEGNKLTAFESIENWQKEDSEKRAIIILASEQEPGNSTGTQIVMHGKPENVVLTLMYAIDDKTEGGIGKLIEIAFIRLTLVKVMKKMCSDMGENKDKDDHK